MNVINICGITIQWDMQSGTCSFSGLPVAMMWTDTTLAGLMSGVRSMVGTERFGLALQSEGRNSVEADWKVMSTYPSFEQGFAAIATIAAAAGWGVWEIVSIDRPAKECVFRVRNSWESHYQRKLGVDWGCGMLAGKMAGYATKLFGTNCWAEQTSFAARGDEYDSFCVRPSPRTVEQEIDALLLSDNATKADMAVALGKLQQEIAARAAVERTLKEYQEDLELRVIQRTGELQVSEAKFRSVVESSPMGIHLYELSDRDELIFVGHNPAANKILGIDCGQFLGMTIEAAFPALADSEVPGQYRHVARSNGVWQTQQISYEDKRIKGAFEVYAFQTSPGKMAALFLDVTEKLQKQEEIRRLEKSVQHMQNIESLGVLAGGIAHDFNNILTAIIGSLNVARESLPPGYQDAELLADAEKAAWRARDLTQQLLTFSKGGEPIRTTASMAAVIRDSADFLLRGSTVKAEYDMAADLWLVDIDTGQMSQVVQNIIINARNAMPGGGIVRISAENIPELPASVLPLPHDRSYIRIGINDQGAGIPESIRDRIFEPYFTTRAEGSGLGLAVAFSIIKKHDGYIHCESDPGAGTTFWIYLPRSDKTLTIPRSQVQPTAGRRGRILVMDDHDSIRRLYEVVGRNLGHEMLFAADGRDAIEHHRREGSSIDLTIMDLTIPGGIGGKDAAAAVLAINPRARIIVSSGYSTDPVLAHHQEFGFCAVLPKPFKVSEAVELINRVMADSA